MKTAKLVIGIVSIVLFALILFQSCAAGISNALEENGESGGSAGFFAAFCMLIAGIVGIATRKGTVGGYVAGGFYILGGLIGIALHGSYSDLVIWSVLAFIFAAVFILGGAMKKKPAAEKDAAEQENNH